MTNANTTPSPVPFEIAQQFIADFHFLSDYQERSSDFYNNPAHSDVYRDVFITAGTSLLKSSEMILELLSRAYPAEFLGYCSNSEIPHPELTEEQKILVESYLTK